MYHIVGTLVAVVLFTVPLRAEGPPVFIRQEIDSPKDRYFWYGAAVGWTDVDGDGRIDITAGSSSGRYYWYHQSPHGWPSTPTQSWELPEGAAWARPIDIDEDGKHEILVSCAGGLACYRQNEAVFDTRPQWLIEAKQIYAESSVGCVNWARTYKQELPVILADRLIWYRVGKDGTYAPNRTVELDCEVTLSSQVSSLVSREKWSGPSWSLGGSDPRWLQVSVTARQKAKHDADKKTADECLKDLVRSLETNRKNGKIRAHGLVKGDIDGDGLKDAFLWYMSKDLNPRVTCKVYVRRSDGLLPQQPDQVLRSGGYPPGWWGPSTNLVDVDNDGDLDLMLVKLKNKPISFRSLLEMLMAGGGMEWYITIRHFDRDKGRFSRGADFKRSVAMPWPWISLEHDFNGDGRPDLMIGSTERRLDVYLGTDSADLFEPKPGVQFDRPLESTFPEVNDLNGDNRADLRTVDLTTGKMIVYLSKVPEHEEGSK
ncbi:MAG: FG-GAP repeat domain-containing protein [Planctomycetota bacterium]